MIRKHISFFLALLLVFAFVPIHAAEGEIEGTFTVYLSDAPEFIADCSWSISNATAIDGGNLFQDETDAWVLVFKALGKGMQTITVTVEDASGNLYQGTAVVFMMAAAAEQTVDIFLSPYVKGDVNIRFDLKATVGEDSFYVFDENAVFTLTGEDSTVYDYSYQSGSYYFSVPADKAYSLSVSATQEYEGYIYSFSRSVNLSASYFARDGQLTVSLSAEPGSGVPKEDTDTLSFQVKVQDEEGTPLVGASVTVTDLNGVEETVATDENGLAAFSGLPLIEVPYVLRATYAGRGAGDTYVSVSQLKDSVYTLTIVLQEASSPASLRVVDEAGDPISGMEAGFYFDGSPSDAVSGITDTDGCVSLQLPTGKTLYTSFLRTANDLIAYDDYTSVPEDTCELVYAPLCEDGIKINLSSNIYLEGQLFQTYSSTASLKGTGTWTADANIGDEHGITQCYDATATLNGTPITLQTSPDGNGGILSECSIDATALTNGDSLVLNFYYRYIDQEALYDLSISHVFVGTDGQPVLEEKLPALSLHAGESFSVNALTSPDALTITRDIPGYGPAQGNWYLGLVILEGGDSSVTGRFTFSETPAYVVADSMIHSDANLRFFYYFRPHTEQSPSQFFDILLQYQGYREGSEGGSDGDSSSNVQIQPPQTGSLDLLSPCLILLSFVLHIRTKRR